MIQEAFYIENSAHFDPTKPVAVSYLVTAAEAKLERESHDAIEPDSLQDLIRHIKQPEVRIIKVEASEHPPGRFRHPETHQEYRVLMNAPGGCPLLTNP